MFRYGVVLYGFLVRKFITLRRYPLNFVGQLATYLLVFMLIFYGGSHVAPVALGESLDAIVVGYFLLSTVMSTFFSLSGLINREAKYGTLEQLYTSPVRFPAVLSSAVVANIVVGVSIGVVNLLVVLAIAGESLTIDIPTIVPVLGLSLLQAIGVGFLIGGTALIYKRIRGLFSVIQFFFIGTIAYSMTERLWPRLLPVGQGAAMLHEAMANGTTIAEFQLHDHVLLLASSIVYLGFGYLVFHFAQHYARERGLLDEY